MELLAELLLELSFSLLVRDLVHESQRSADVRATLARLDPLGRSAALATLLAHWPVSCSK